MKKNSDFGGASKNPFDTMDRQELIRRCLEQEDELRVLRPKPAKFKLGQVVAQGTKNNWMRGQPALYFSILSVENRLGEWYYGYNINGPHSFAVFPEKALRVLDATEMDGTAEKSAQVGSAFPAISPEPTPEHVPHMVIGSSNTTPANTTPATTQSVAAQEDSHYDFGV